MKLVRPFVLAVVAVALLATASLGSAAGAGPDAAKVYEPAGAQGSLYRLYRAHLEREPDAGGYEYWWSRVRDGLSLSRASDAFARSPEFQSRYGSLDDAGFVELVYDHVLDREADAAGAAYWLDQLANNGMTRGALMLNFSDSTEFRGITADALPPGYVPCPEGDFADPARWTWTEGPSPWGGVTYSVGLSCGPVEAHVVRIAPTANVQFDTLVSDGELGKGREPTSSMCGRRTAAVCVNASYPICFTCVSPHGAAVRDRRLLVTPTDHQWQVWYGDDGHLSAKPWEVEIELRSGGESLRIDDLNHAPGRAALVLLNRDWATSTGAAEDAYEVVFGSPGPITTGGVLQAVLMRDVYVDGDAPIPADGFVLTGRGAGADRLYAFTEGHRGQPFELVVRSPRVVEAFSGHPQLLDRGVELDLDPADAKVTKRHPRTVIGWDAAGTRWLVVVDGRQNRSVGLDLYETTDLMRMLGATTAVNLDGGGSSTLSTWCGPTAGWCARNSPSDGSERRVSVALGVVPRDGR